MRRLAYLLAIGLAVPALASCGGSKSGSGMNQSNISGLGRAAGGPATMRLQSAAFADRVRLPARFTCDGKGVSPPLAWTAAPRGTQSLVVLLEDPDASGGTFLHWSVYAIPKNTRKLSQGSIPSHAARGRNSFGKLGYGPPCPPKGDRPHRYVFSVYAVPHRAAFGPGADVTAVGRLAATALAKGVLTARYSR